MKNKLFLAVIGLVLSLIFTVPGYASGHTLSLKSTVTIPKDGLASVKHVFTSRQANRDELPATVTLAADGHDVKNVSAKAVGGGELEASYNSSSDLIEVSIPESKQNRSGKWSFTVSYKTSLLQDLESMQASQIGAVNTNLAVTSHDLTVSADLDLGFASIRGPEPSKTGIGVGLQSLTFSNKSGQLEAAPILLFGDSAQADVTFNSTLHNDSWWWSERTLTLPPDTNQQRVVLDSIEPRPANVRLDRDGNILALYRLGPRQSVDISARMRVTLETFDYKLDDAGSVESTDQLLKERYTRLTDNWQPVGVEVEADGTDAAVLVEEIFSEVVERAKSDTDSQQLQLATRGGALRYSDWLVGELRNRGVPARAVVGLLHSDGQRLLEEPMAHAWAEAYVAGTGWVTLDPWLAMHTGGFTGSDPLHVAVGLWGIEEDRPPVVLDGIELAFSKQPVEEIPEVSEQSTLTATKHVILPFFSILSLEAQFPAGTITDNVGMEIDGSTLGLGSVAPMQASRMRFARLGTEAFSTEQVALGSTEDGFSAWHDRENSVSYVPMITIGALLAVLLGFWWWRRKRGFLRFKSQPHKESWEPIALGADEENGAMELDELIESTAPETVTPSSPSLNSQAIKQHDTSRRVATSHRRPITRPGVHRSATMRRDESRLRSRQLIQ